MSFGNESLAAPKWTKSCRRLLNIKDAAEYLGRTEWAVRELIWKGLPVVRIDRRIQLDLQDLDALIDSAKVTEPR
jgi:hypothetical protein